MPRGSVVAHKEMRRHKRERNLGGRCYRSLSHLYSQPLELGLLECGSGAAQQSGRERCGTAVRTIQCSAVDGRESESRRSVYVGD